jgi:hypothetical protein
MEALKKENSRLRANLKRGNTRWKEDGKKNQLLVKEATRTIVANAKVRVNNSVKRGGFFLSNSLRQCGPGGGRDGTKLKVKTKFCKAAGPSEFIIPAEMGLKVGLGGNFTAGGRSLQHEYSISRRSAMRETKMVAEFCTSTDDFIIGTLTDWLEQDQPELPFVMFEKTFDGTSHKVRRTTMKARRRPTTGAPSIADRPTTGAPSIADGGVVHFSFIVLGPWSLVPGLCPQAPSP